MPIKFPCQSCGQILSVSSKKVGRRAKCPNCSEPLVVPPRGEAATKMQDRRHSVAQADDANPYARFVVYDDETEFVYESEQTPAEKSHPVDRDLVAVPRHVLYAQGILLAVLALVCFALGIMVGGGLSSDGNPALHSPRPCEIRGTVAYLGQGGREIPDNGAVIIVMPKDRRPDQRADVAGLMPQDAMPNDDHQALRMLREIEGSYTRTDAEGRFHAAVPDIGDYYILVVSRASDRTPAQQIPNRVIEELGRYFHPAYDLLGDKKYDWQVYRIKADRTLKVVLN